MHVQSLGQEDPLKKEMATHSSILAWKIPCTEKPGRLQSIGSQRVRNNWKTNTYIYIIIHALKDSILKVQHKTNRWILPSTLSVPILQEKLALLDLTKNSMVY